MSDTHFNDHYYGQCYVNRSRRVNLDRAEPFLAASLAVKKGKKDEQGRPEYTQQLDCKLVGSQAISMVEALIEHLASLPKKVSVSGTFKVGDIEPGKPYTAKQGKYKGQVITPERGRLIKLTHVYVDGVRFREDLDAKEVSIQPIKSEAKPEKQPDEPAPPQMPSDETPVQSAASGYQAVSFGGMGMSYTFTQ